MQIQFEQPIYLLGLLLVPCFLSLALWNRKILGIQAAPIMLFRCLVVAAVVLALSGLRLEVNSDRMAVVYVLDQSSSIDQSLREQMLSFASQHANRFRDRNREDYVGAVVFGGEASIAVPPFQGELPQIEVAGLPIINSDATNIEQAITMARAAFPAATSKRIVLISDGNETQGAIEKAVQHASEAGIGIDVVPVARRSQADAIVERIDVPANLRMGQTFEGRVVVTCNSIGTADSSAVVSRGDLVVTLKSLAEEKVIISSPVEITAGSNVFPFRYVVNSPGGYTFDAKYLPSDASDAFSLNNRASSFALVSGKGRVLLIEPWNETGQQQMLVELLERDEIQVDVQSNSSTFASISDLLNYDLIILANLPRVSGESSEALTSLTDLQLELLERNTRQFGAGLLMLGGPEAFGAGGWNGSLLEQAMPVSFDVQNTKVNAIGALMVVIDASGSMTGEKIQLCKAAAKEAIKSLREVDYVGVLTFDSSTQEIIPLQQVGKRTHILPRIGKIAPGGGTDMYPAMQQGFRQLSRVDAMVKHMIVLSDGQTPQANFDSLVSQMQEAGITVTTVAIGDDADGALMNRIATGGAGKYYKVISPKAIPRIVMRESRRIAKPLIYESPAGIDTSLVASHPVTQGLTQLPPLKGFVLTTSKQNSLVQDLAVANEPYNTVHPILSTWQYGLGRTAVWTTDTGQRWTNSWSSWPDQQKLYTQLARWLMRPQGNTTDYQVVTSVSGDHVEVVVNAVSEAGEYREFLDIQTNVLGPELDGVSLQLRQTGPGRYAGRFPARQSGTYVIGVVPGEGQGAIVAGVSVPFGNEFREYATNWNVLEMMARTIPQGGAAGTVLPSLDQLVRKDFDIETLSDADPFRPGVAGKASVENVWPWIVLVACGLFLGDVTLRRVRLDLSSILGMLRMQKKDDSSKDSMDSVRLELLKETKRKVSRQGNISASETAETDLGQHNGVAPKALRLSDTDSSQQPEPSDYLQRLKDAKSRAKQS